MLEVSKIIQNCTVCQEGLSNWYLKYVWITATEIFSRHSNKHQKEVDLSVLRAFLDF